jgi:chaperonin GroES
MPTSSVPIQPLADYIVAETEEAATKTASGIYLPEGAKEKPKTVRVVAVGKGVKEVKVGDRILYEGYSETNVKLNSKDYVLVREEKVIATVK